MSSRVQMKQNVRSVNDLQRQQQDDLLRQEAFLSNIKKQLEEHIHQPIPEQDQSLQRQMELQNQAEAVSNLKQQLESQLQRLQQEQANQAHTWQEEQQRTHQQLQQQIQSVHQRIDAAQNQVQHRLQALESRFEGRLQQVDHKIDHLRHELESRAQSQLDRSRQNRHWITERLAAIQNDLPSLGLMDEALNIQATVDQAKKREQDGDAPTALALSDKALSDLKTLEQSQERRQAQLYKSRHKIQIQLDQGLKSLEEPGVQRFYTHESQQMKEKITQWKVQLPSRYGDYEQLAVESHEDQNHLEQIQRQIQGMVMEVPVLEQQYTRREQQLKKLLSEVLTPALGPLSEKPEVSFAKPGDLKSHRIGRFNLGGNQVIVELPLSETEELGLHLSNAASNQICTEMAHKVLQEYYRYQRQCSDPEKETFCHD